MNKALFYKKTFLDIILRLLDTNQMKLDFAVKQDSSIISIEMNGINSSQVFPVFQLLRSCSE